MLIGLLLCFIAGPTIGAVSPDSWCGQVDADSAWRYGPDFGPSGYVATNLPAITSASFDDAYALVAAHIIGGETNRLQLSAYPQPLRAGSTTLTTWSGHEVTAPWDEYWLFFADDDPAANWAHPCRYIFVARDLSAIAVQRAQTPLNIDLEVLIRYEPPVFEVRRAAGARHPKALYHDGSVSNCYAVIISGGCDTNQNGTRFWGDAAAVYSTLTLTYGYPKTNIYTYISDGTNPAVDAADLITYQYINSPFDLDGDGLDDTLGEANAANISNVFLHLQGVLQSNDQLFVFVTDHGGHTAGGAERDTELNLWGSGVIHDSEMEALTTNIPCPILFVMEQCYSGGFIDNLNQPRRVIATAASYNNTSSGGDTYIFYDQWCYEWISAMRGFYPVTNQPWANSEPCEGDLNGDGYVSFREASHYANAHAPDGDTPQYADHPAFLGSQLFLMQPTNPIPHLTDWVELAPFKTPLATNVPFDVRIAARDPQGAVTTNFTGAVTLETVADIVNPGLTVGKPASPYSFLLRTGHSTVRTQVIYPANLMGGPRNIDQLSLHVDTIPTQTMNQFTIRLRHSDLNSYPLYPTQVVWETDWVTVYQKDRDITSNGWVTFLFTNTFAYDGLHSLMADFSFSNDYATEDAAITISYEGVDAYRSLHRALDGESGDPLVWSGTNPPSSRTYLYPHIQFGPLPYQPQVSIVPTNLTDFTDGVWTGALTALNAADNVRILLRTSNTSWDTETDRFPIREYLFNVVAPQFSADGSFVLNWNSGTGYTYRVLRSTNLLNGFAPYATNLPATPPLNTFTGIQDSTAADFYCVEEE